LVHAKPGGIRSSMQALSKVGAMTLRVRSPQAGG
jgi:hypothetical protein